MGLSGCLRIKEVGTQLGVLNHGRGVVSMRIRSPRANREGRFLSDRICSCVPSRRAISLTGYVRSPGFRGEVIRSLGRLLVSSESRLGSLKGRVVRRMLVRGKLPFNSDKLPGLIGRCGRRDSCVSNITSTLRMIGHSGCT